MTYHLFDAAGIELEYMIVDKRTLNPRPIADRILIKGGKVVDEVEDGRIAWSNELALHVIELKTNGPRRKLEGCADDFHKSLQKINKMIRKGGARLMPTAAHPWMHPSDSKLWPHDNKEIYEKFHEIFDCSGHGWTNLQSMHVNLPFHDDAEFERLHAAIRLVLPILPGLAASSPVLDGKMTNLLDSRLETYRHNCSRIPSVTGSVIPETAHSRAEYEENILQVMYEDIKEFDKGGILQFEWLNARGAIARFDRNTVEIRVIDVQECPQADVAIVAIVVEAVKAIAEGRWLPLEKQHLFGVEKLASIFEQAIIYADETAIPDKRYLACFGLAHPCTARDVWRHLAAELLPARSPYRTQIDFILEHGVLARRIRNALGESPSRKELMEVYGQLCDCLEKGEQFLP